ncbi:MAG: hypothetical protein PUC82_00745 [bacterium]|nr:hypothetical protein [bacterium]
MPKKELLVADPYDEEQLKMLTEFELENDLGSSLTSSLREISSHHSKEEYNQILRSRNEIEQHLLLCDNDKIIDYCSLNAYKDIKSCYLIFPTSKKVSQSKKLISLATQYAVGLGMLEIFVTANVYDRALHEVLELDGYENLGDENGLTSFVKSFEKEGVLDGTNKKY